MIVKNTVLTSWPVYGPPGLAGWLWGGRTVVERTGGGEEVEREGRSQLVPGDLQLALYPVRAHQVETSPTSPDHKLSSRSQHPRLHSHWEVNQTVSQFSVNTQSADIPLSARRLCPAIPANAHRHFHLSQVSLRLASLRSRPTDILETWEWETYYSFSITCYIQPFPRQGLAN